MKPLFKLVRYLKREKLASFLAVFFSIVSVAATVVATMQLRTLTNVINDAAMRASDGADMATALDMGEITRLCVLLAGLYLASVLSAFMQSFLLTGVVQRVSYALRADICAKISRLPLAYFDVRSIGDTMSRVTNDVDTVAQSLSTALSTTVSSAVQLVLVAVIMFLTSWQMAVTSLVTVPLAAICAAVVMKFSDRHFVRQQVTLGELNGKAEEAYSGLLVIKAFGRDARFEEAFCETNRRLQRAMYRANTISGLTQPLSNFLNKLGYVAVCVVGGILVAGRRADLGALAAFLIYINLFQQPISNLAQAVNVFQQASAAAVRVFEFLDAEEQPDESGKTARLAPERVQGRVEFCHVRFGYDPAKPVIRDFCARVEAGQKVAIVGQTGAGKTTLVNLLMRFYDADDGEIFMDGVPISSMPRENVRALFAMVLQDTWLFDGTLRENLIYTGNASEEELKVAIRAANLTHFVESLPQGLDTRLNGEELSAGQKQLITIARAMLSRAPVMILDEATSSVDTFTEQVIARAMDALTEGRTSFVIAHRLSTIRNSDLILVLDHGDIVEQGTHDALLARGGAYARLYNSQFSAPLL